MEYQINKIEILMTSLLGILSCAQQHFGEVPFSTLLFLYPAMTFVSVSAFGQTFCLFFLQPTYFYIYIFFLPNHFISRISPMTLP